MDPFKRDIRKRMAHKMANMKRKHPSRMPVLPHILSLDKALASGYVLDPALFAKTNGAYNGARNFSFPPVPIGSKYSSPSKASSSSSLQQRDLGLAPNPNIVEEIGDRHWHVQGRRGRISIRNDKKIVTYLRRQLRKRIQQWYDETDSDEYDEEKHDRMPLNLDSEAYAKRTPSCRHRKKAIFEQYNDVGGRVSKEGTMVKEDTFVMRHPLIDMSPLPTSRVHSSSDSVLDVIDGDIMDNNNTLTQSSALKYTSQNGDNDVVVNGNSLEKGVTFAEREFEIVPEDKRTAPKSSSSMSITSISSGTSSQRQTPVHREGQVPETLPEIHTTKHDSHSSQSSTAQSPPLVDVLKLPKIAGASTEYENVNEDSNIDDEVRQAQERPDTRGSTVDSDEQIVAFTPVPTPYPLPIGRSDTNDYLKLDYPNTVDQIIRGQLNVKCQINKRIIRIYVSSGISDCEPERNAMMEKVYPKLRQHCTERGFELQISDPNWGLKDSIFDDQGHTDLCLQELKRARQVSRGPNFVTFLAQKYGASEIPTCISCEEFNALTNLLQGRRDEYIASHRPPTSEGDVEAPSGDGSLVREKSSDSLKTKEPNVSKTVEAQKTQVSEGEGGKSKLNQSHDDDVVKEKSDRDYDSEITLLNTWYKLDENTVPPVYRLQLISSQFKDINARDNVRRVTAKQQWGIQHRRLEALFQTYIRDITSDPARIDNCYKSVLEREIEEGILNLEYKPFEEVQWFRRKITDLEMNVGDFNAKEFMDIIPMSSKANKERSDRLHVLSNIKIPDRTSLSNVHEYSVGWHADGIRPETNRGHYLYIEKMARDLGDVLINKVDRAIHDNMAATDAKSKLYDEIAQHVQFVRERSRVFHGRKETMNKIKEYVRMGPRQPLIIHGQSGYGKTSVMAKAAKDAPYMLKYGEPHVVVRLVGITGESLHIRQLLRSMCLQLCYIFHQNSAMIPHDYRGALNDFNGRLAGATEDNPLFIFMDSLDQLSNENDGRGLQWLPKELPEHVYMIVSTLSEDHYDCFSTLKKMFPEGDNFVEIPELPESDAEFILDHLLAHENRAMTTEQHDVITTAFRKCPTPLYLRLAINESKTWRSYSTGKQIWIADSVKKVITAIFSKMESQHGEPFIRRALGYITAARSGVTHSELLDLLSLDDLVMGDVSSHMTVNVRRFPPILLMRLRNDLDWYLTEQSADDTWTYRWSHRKLHEGAVERYLEQKDKAPSYHSALSEYFMGIWANKKKPYPGSESGAFRYVDPQALTYNINTPTGKTKTIFNLRKLNELPHHLINSNQFEKLKLAILLNYEWFGLNYERPLYGLFSTIFTTL
uniref:NACHT and WD repeat domain-containing protein 1-like n=1 Tax=Saccoglossus kowalevskii TaxID=10224 RepID=A0ABM0MGF2_SACKO|nr:PREDICTED: NACHT and WD repeat domain-containing protein 1-like [Saccoglossus kowalevskii]